MKKCKILMLGCVLILLASCTNPEEEFFDFTEPEITGVTPGDDSRGISESQEIKVSFSEPIDRDSAEGAFSLSVTGDNSNNAGEFSWENDKTMIFTPTKGWTPGEKYTVTIERTVQDVNRNKLQRKYVSCFFIGNDFTNPTVTGTNPYIQQNPVIITLNFSTSMDTVSLHEALSVKPAFDYRTELQNDNQTLVIYAKEDLPILNEYTLTIGTDAKSTSGLPLLRDYNYQFAMYNDVVRPEILQVRYKQYTENGFNYSAFVTACNTIAGGLNYCTAVDSFTALDEAAGVNQVGRFIAFVVEFSETMDTASVQQALSVTPGLSGKFYWFQDVTSHFMLFVPDEGIPQNQQYTFSIKNTAKDAAGNTLDTDSANYLFESNIPPIRIVQIIFNEGMGITGEDQRLPETANADTLAAFNDIFLKDSNSGVELGVDVLPPNISGELPIDIVFEAAAGAVPDIDPATLYPNISVKHVLGSSGDPLIVSYKIIKGLDSYKIKIIANGVVSDETNPQFKANVYELKVTGGPSGVRDIFGNYMEDSLRVLFKVNRSF